MSQDYTISALSSDQIEFWLARAVAMRGDAHQRRLIGFAQDVQRGARVIWLAQRGEALLGQITVQHGSEYPPFRQGNIFEIVDLWVDTAQRQAGIGRALLHQAVDYARRQQCRAVGLGVGVTENFGPAHRLYASEGFRPDGSGLWAQGRPVKPGDKVTMEEGVLMMWVKAL